MINSERNMNDVERINVNIPCINLQNALDLQSSYQWCGKTIYKIDTFQLTVNNKHATIKEKQFIFSDHIK